METNSISSQKKQHVLIDPSTISLVFANILVIFAALFEHWDTATVLWIYWLQSVIIGLFTFVNIITLKDFSTQNFKINNVCCLLFPFSLWSVSFRLCYIFKFSISNRLYNH